MTLPLYTIHQVSKHNKKRDAWIVIRGVVYNITKFAGNHHGGRHILLKNAGKDVTGLFETHYKNRKRREEIFLLMHPYIIGYIRPDLPM